MAMEHLMDSWKFYTKGSGIQHVDRITTLPGIIMEMWSVKNWDLMKAMFLLMEGENQSMNTVINCGTIICTVKELRIQYMIVLATGISGISVTTIALI